MHAHNITSKSTLGNVFTGSINKHIGSTNLQKEIFGSFNDDIYWIPCQWRCNSCDSTVVFGHLSRGVTRGVCSELIAHWPAHPLGGEFVCVLKPCLFVLPPQIGRSDHQLCVSVEFDSCLFVPDCVVSWLNQSVYFSLVKAFCLGCYYIVMGMGTVGGFHIRTASLVCRMFVNLMGEINLYSVCT